MKPLYIIYKQSEHKQQECNISDKVAVTPVRYEKISIFVNHFGGPGTAIPSVYVCVSKQQFQKWTTNEIFGMLVHPDII